MSATLSPADWPFLGCMGDAAAVPGSPWGALLWMGEAEAFLTVVGARVVLAGVAAFKVGGAARTGVGEVGTVRTNVGA